MTIRILGLRSLPTSATAGATSTVGEPSVGRVDQQTLFTGNWYAAKSLDGGASWLHLDPFTFFPPADGGFCCDQTALYDPSRDLFIWLLQYVRAGGRNTLRVAVTSDPTLVDDSAWLWWDLVPAQIEPTWTNQWFDYNHAALSDDFLYIVTNTFTATSPERFTRCVAFRLPLDDLRNGTPPALSYFETDSFSIRASQGAADVMYFGCHVDEPPARLRIFRWADASSTVTSTDVPVGPWVGGNGYFAPGPDGNNWLGRCDPRITAGWLASGTLGFMWSVDRMGTRPLPHIRVVRIDESTLSLVDEPDIWSRDVALAYPDACPNGEGDLGVTLFFGGGPVAPSLALGARDDAAGRWEFRAVRQGSDGPADGKWGDYLTCRPAHRDAASWVAVGYVLDGGPTLGFVRPLLVRFAR